MVFMRNLRVQKGCRARSAAYLYRINIRRLGPKSSISRVIEPGGEKRERGLLWRTVLIESLREFTGDLVRVATFDLESLEHVDQLAVFQQRDRW